MSDFLLPSQRDSLLQTIEQQSGAINDELEQLSADSKPVTLDQQSVGRVSRIDAIQQQEMASSRLRSLQVRQQQLHRARHQLQENSSAYGYCVECGSEIAFPRLAFDPTVSHCVQCA